MTVATRQAAGLLAALLLCSAAAAEERPEFTFGYLDLSDDIRYTRWGVHPVDIRSETNRVDFRPRAGAEMGVADIRAFGRRAGVQFTLRAERVADADGLPAALEAIRAETGAFVFLIDAPGAAVRDVAAATLDQDVILINVSAVDDRLRGEACAAHLLHTSPSRQMLADAAAQYLVARDWNEVLVLQGSLEEDARTVEAFRHAASTYGLKIDEERTFVLSNDPRMRDRNDLDLLTGRADYEAVFVADIDREFARSVPYSTQDPAAVVGAAGLRPTPWHWSYLRHGAPQVHGRFERQTGRRMEGTDWAAWVAIRAIGEAIVRTASTAKRDLHAYLLGPDFRLDGSKGPALSFRPWNGQLRQPVMLATEDWVTAVAPLAGFIHQTNDLDTLGRDARTSDCREFATPEQPS
ncbi:MAG: branched-chain amino acid ABC transporter substrate-binding protein [Rhodospirillales bacterium]|nr:branched-chain amino acid ABC transporter substrate-binding protein [Rhodospirillales bacterium]